MPLRVLARSEMVVFQLRQVSFGRKWGSVACWLMVCNGLLSDSMAFAGSVIFGIWIGKGQDGVS